MRRLVLLTLLLAAAAGCSLGRRAVNHAAGRVVTNVSEGMRPTMKPGDLAAIDPGHYDANPVRRFDLVLIDAPEGDAPPGTKYFKRVVALGGETVEIRGGALHINGQAVREPFPVVAHEGSEQFGPFQVPPGEFFLLGDNRPNSYDSRHWQRRSLAKSLIYAKVTEVIPQ